MPLLLRPPSSASSASSGRTGRRGWLRRWLNPTSLRLSLVGLWAAIFTVAAALAGLMWALSHEGADAQIARGQLLAESGCAGMTAALQRAAAPDADETPAATLDAVVDLALRGTPGVEGGFWSVQRGMLAYAFPTYDGSGLKQDVPAAERERIEALAARTAAAGVPLTELRPGIRETVVLHACPAGPLVGWTLMRVATVSAANMDRLATGMALLLGFVLLSGGWLGWTLTRWSGGLRALEAAVQTAPMAPGTAALAAPTGLTELDRLGQALNDYARRLGDAQREQQRLAAELARAERLAALGGLAAGLAHEIRSPLATARLKAENALAAGGTARVQRCEEALHVVLAQSARVEALVGSLLALTQSFHPQRLAVPWPSWLDGVLAQHREAAVQAGVSLGLDIAAGLADQAQGVALFDPELVARALDNLLRNALDHVQPGGAVRLAAVHHPGLLRLTVSDDGPGVPSELQSRLFEPFASGRPSGTGLGLALVSEIARAHGGAVRHRPLQPHGACFEIDLPWPAS